LDHGSRTPITILWLSIRVNSRFPSFPSAWTRLSQYEFEIIGEPRRISDEEWRGNGFFSLEFFKALFQKTFPPTGLKGLNRRLGLKATWCREFRDTATGNRTGFTGAH